MSKTIADDNIISALIGLVGATVSEHKADTTDEVVRNALLVLGQNDPTEQQAADTVAAVHAEKQRIAPGCSGCASPCGNTSDYDMAKFYAADAEMQECKRRLLEEACRYAGLHDDMPEDVYKAIAYLGYDLEPASYEKLIGELNAQNDAAALHRAELSIRKKFHKQLFAPFARACRDYQLIQDGDRIAVCISGGKDSMLMAKLFQEIQKHRKVQFDLTFLVMDPGYLPQNRRLIEENAKLLGIPITIFESSIFDAVDTVEKNPCYLCARMRRGYLYSKAKELGCNKIALGHHYDDVIETILMGMLQGAQIQTMMPKLHSTNFEGMELIRPMYLIREEDVIRWRDYNELHFLQCACHFTETCSTVREDGSSESKRMETKHLIAELKKTNPQVESNIFNSVTNVNLSTVIAYKQDGVRHHFLDTYEARGNSPSADGEE